ncbi:type 2 lantibiotic [Butyrivibrio sp. XB500-5]|uniref:mersacidin family lantibiotic n=1 Tax=Butyrivibrio sp. XB500-5 TaxID=2364880 RepID=UPI000EA86F0F|nr:lichenicidin A2 family type 2 lantibiotic [Butyrivibrio sp. XB500-5]RKM59698.1 type 2 lantibiotic [Butyrivibrio sp. XB500-5]
MSKENLNKVVGNSFEDLKDVDMANIQGAGDTEAEGWSSVVKTIIEYTIPTYELTKATYDIITGKD